MLFCVASVGRAGEESIPMLMINHTDKEDSTVPRSRPQSNVVDKSPPRLVEISSNPGTPLKVTEIKPSGLYLEEFCGLMSSLFYFKFSPFCFQEPQQNCDIFTSTPDVTTVGFKKWTNFDIIFTFYCVCQCFAEPTKC